MAWIFDTATPTFPQNMDELHKRLKLWVQTSVFNISLNPIKLNDNPDAYFDLLKWFMSIGYSGPDLEIWWDYYFSSYFWGTEFLQLFPPPGKLKPCYMSEVWAGTFKTSISLVQTEDQQLDLMQRYSAWIISQKSYEWWSITTPNGIMPGPFEQYPLIVRLSDNEDEDNQEDEENQEN